ncbi:MAG: transcription elongation factor GreA [Erysipelothrix sp.]|nr:transcription elongation factor GreA [Erysipelothrix sp.]
MSNKVAVTKEGLLELQKELDYLIHTVRKEVKEELQAAREQGDLSENADYDAARDRQAKIEARIRELESMLNNIEIINEKKKSKRVGLGSVVRIKELDTDEEIEYSIVGSVEADPLNGKLSNVSPLALAMIDKMAGNVVTVRVETPYEVEIISVK